MNLTTIGKKEIGIIALTFILLVCIFYFSPLEAGRDWLVMNRSLQRFVSGEVVYQFTFFEDGPYVYYLPPWFTVLFSPLTLLPEKLNWSLICAVSILGVLALAQHYKLSHFQLFLFFISPPFLYNLRQGNIDIILLLVVFAPREIWPIICITKPHVVGGLLFSLFQERKIWLRTFLIGVTFLGLSFYFFGLWPLAIAEMSSQVNLPTTPHNQFRGLWPLQLIVAVSILALGFERKDERLFLSASPFLLSYTTIGNLIGLALSVISAMKWWQGLAFVLTWWIVLIVS